jgi:hypothetical protein
MLARIHNRLATRSLCKDNLNLRFGWREKSASTKEKIILTFCRFQPIPLKFPEPYLVLYSHR